MHETECRQGKVPFFSCMELKIDIFVALASFAAVVEGLAERLLEDCLERLMICIYRDVVSSVQVLVPLFHARHSFLILA